VLAGVRVVELASELGAFAGKMLADLGAEVIVVEPPDGHATRWYEPFLDDAPHPDRSLWWWYYNTGKLSVTLDLDDVGDATRFRQLVGSAEVVLEAQPPGRLAALGLDYDDLAPDQTGLVWTSVTPFGRRDPRSGEPATDLTIAARAGPAWSCGYDDRSLPPVRPGGNQSLHTAALWAVMGTMAALYTRQTLRLGQLVDVSAHAASNVTTEAATYEWLVAQATVERQTFRHAAVWPTPPRILRTNDGHDVIAAWPRYAAEYRAIADWVNELGLAEEVEEFFFVELAVERGGVSLSELSSDPESAAMYRAGSDALRCVAAHLRDEEFFTGAQRRGIAVGIVLAPEEVVGNEQFVARGFPVELPHEDLGRSFVYPGAPYRAPTAPWVTRRRAPHVGEHNDEVLARLPER